MIDNRNLLLAVVLSLAILIGFQYLVIEPQQQQMAQQQATQQTLGSPEATGVPSPGGIGLPRHSRAPPPRAAT